MSETTTNTDTMLTQQILQRLDRIDARMDGLVSRSEHQAILTKLDGVVPRPEFDKTYEGFGDLIRRHTESLDKVSDRIETLASKDDLEKIDTRVAEIEKSRIPAWLSITIGGVATSLIGSLAYWALTNFHH